MSTKAATGSGGGEERRRLTFERDLHTWLLGEGGAVQRVTYARPSGTCAAVLLTPKRPPRYLVAGEATGVPVPGLVVTAHATGNDKYFPFVAIYRLLLRRGYAVFAFDLDGHGRESSHVLTERDWPTMLPAALAQAAALQPGVPVHLLGQSLGALLIYATLANLPAEAMPLLRSAVLLSMPYSGKISARPLAGELKSLLSLSLWRSLQLYGPWGLIPALGAFKRQVYPLRLAPESPGLSTTDVATYIAFVDDLVAALPTAATLPVPAMYLYGTADAVTPPAQAATLVPELIAGATHFTLPFSPRCHQRLASWLTAHA